MLSKYGKKSSSLLELKKSFIEDNNKLIKKEQEVIENYKKQPCRTQCKNCQANLNHNQHLFIRQGIKYTLCSRCNQLNGEFQDTLEFNNSLYTSSNYAKNYTDKDSFNSRLNVIYKPKVDFLLESLNSCNENINQIKCLDFGCGSGYFCEALALAGIESRGYDVSAEQVEFGNEIWQRDNLRVKSIEATKEVLKTTQCNLVSMIGVLEHLQNPNEFIDIINKNPNIKYFYMSVPLFSLSSFFQLIFKDIYERQLGSGHTHLYTKKSLEYMQEKYNFQRVSQWYFGTDIVDLYRSSLVTLNENNSTATQAFEESFTHLIDKFQLEIDKCEESSEVHILFKKSI